MKMPHPSNWQAEERGKKEVFGMNSSVFNRPGQGPTVSRRKRVIPGHVPVSLIEPSPENDLLYRPVDPSDPEIKSLARSLRKNGVLEPVVITLDNYIVSGHRRFAAARVAGMESIPCRRVKIRRSDDLDAFVRLLREHNRQRDKTNAEKLREEVVSVSPDEAYRKLREHRRSKAAVDVKALKLGHGPVRCKISNAKQPFLSAAMKVIRERRSFWPLSDRQIHYALLNDPPLKHAGKSDSTYRNDLASYKSLVDLLTRARLEGSICFEAIGDETRPVQVWDTHPSARSFVGRELNNMFCGYYRDLTQSQPNHIELIGEKNTVGSILRPVAADYTIPLTTGRGYCSLPPRCAMAERFEASGKDTLILLFVTDFDPDGEEIAKSFARSMQNDFGIVDIWPIKVALTAEQVLEHKLPPVMRAKASSSRHNAFVKAHGHNVFELESISPEVLQNITRAAIEAVIDRDAFDAEVEAEKQDAAFLEGVRRTACESLKELDGD